MSEAQSEKKRFNWLLVGWPQWIRVPWLRGIYFPFCDVRARLRLIVKAQRAGFLIVSCDELLHITEGLDEHPNNWDYPCACATCRSYAND